MNSNEASSAAKEPTWHSERTAHLRELAAQGLSAPEIAVRLGCGLTRGAVSRKAKRLKIKLVHSASRKPRLPVETNKPSRHDLFWTPERLQHLRDVLPTDTSSAEVARDLGTTKAAVVGKLVRMGWNLPGKPRQVRVLTEDDRTEVLRLLAAGDSIISVMRKTGLSKHAINVVRGVTKPKVVKVVPVVSTPVVSKAFAISDLRRDTREVVARYEDDKWVYAVPVKELHELRDVGFVVTVTGQLDGVRVLYAKLAKDAPAWVGRRAA